MKTFRHYPDMSTRVCSIPCGVVVTNYVEADKGSFHCPPSPEEFEFELYDRKGYRATWLERKMTEKDEMKLLKEWLDHITDDGEP
jgi:hypothetical protein